MKFRIGDRVVYRGRMRAYRGHRGEVFAAGEDVLGIEEYTVNILSPEGCRTILYAREGSLRRLVKRPHVGVPTEAADRIAHLEKQLEMAKGCAARLADALFQAESELAIARIQKGAVQ